MDSSAFRAALEAEDPSAEAVVEGALHLAAAGPKSFRALSDAVQDTLRDSRRDAARIIALGDCLLQVVTTLLDGDQDSVLCGRALLKGTTQHRINHASAWPPAATSAAALTWATDRGLTTPPSLLLPFCQAFLRSSEPGLPGALLAMCRPWVEHLLAPESAAEAAGGVDVLDEGGVLAALDWGVAAAKTRPAIGKQASPLAQLLLFGGPTAVCVGAGPDALGVAPALWLCGALLRLKLWANLEEIVAAAWRNDADACRTVFDCLLARIKRAHAAKIVDRISRARSVALARALTAGAAGVEEGGEGGGRTVRAGIAEVTASTSTSDPALGRSARNAAEQAAAGQGKLRLATGKGRTWSKLPRGTGLLHGGRQLLAEEAQHMDAFGPKFAPRHSLVRPGAVPATDAIRSAMPSQWTRVGKSVGRMLKAGDVQGATSAADTASARQPYGSTAETLRTKMGARAVVDGDDDDPSVLATSIVAANIALEPVLRKVPRHQHRSLLTLALEGQRQLATSEAAPALTAAVAYAGNSLALQCLLARTLAEQGDLARALTLADAWQLAERYAFACEAAPPSPDSPYTARWLQEKAAPPTPTVAQQPEATPRQAALDDGALHATAALRLPFPPMTRAGKGAPTLSSHMTFYASAADLLSGVSVSGLGQLASAGDRPDGVVIPAGSMPVAMVADADDLAALNGYLTHCATAAAASGVLLPIGVDVEWRPSKLFDTAMPPLPKTAHPDLPAVYQALAHTSSLRFPASTLQLATPHVGFIVDLLALARCAPAADVRAVLGDACFHSPHLLKLGFGLAGDLAKLAGSLPALQDACRTAVACVDLAEVFVAHAARRGGSCDLPTLPPSALTSDLRSLAIACQDILGVGLDKQQQVSDWQVRPLTLEQRRYGIMDAYCLLALFAATTQPTEGPGTALARGVEPSGTWWEGAVVSVDVTEAELSKHAIISAALPPILAEVAPGSAALAGAMEAEILALCRTPLPVPGEDSAYAGPEDLQGALTAHGFSPARVLEIDDCATAEDAAAALGVPPGRIVKSLAYMVQGKMPVIVIMPGGARVSAGLLAAALGGVSKRKVKLATPAQCRDAFGYSPGTFPPFAHREGVRVFIEASTPRTGQLYGGGGSLQHCVALRFEELLQLSGGSIAELKRDGVQDAPDPVHAPITPPVARPVAPPAAGAGSAAAPPPPSDGPSTPPARLPELVPLESLFQPPRFLCDAMVARLVRWLRVVGVDALMTRKEESREVTALRAVREGRVVLTRDRKVLEGSTVVPCLLLPSNSTHEQFQLVAEHFGISVTSADLMSRCSKCNNKGFRLLDAEAAAATSANVPAKVLEVVEEYWQCTNSACGKVYWEGPKFFETRDKWSSMLAQEGGAAPEEGSPGQGAP